MSANQSQRQRLHQQTGSSNSDDSGILNERILFLVLASINWDIHAICQVGSVCRKLRAVAKRLLWRELCVYRAPRMMAALTEGVSNSTRMGGGWHALAKLLFFCCGCGSTRNFTVAPALPGHFTTESRFSKTSGRSFLVKKCRDDLLYVSDPCEHPVVDKEDDLGIYRGVFKGFMKSRTRAILIRRQAKLEEEVRCPYCGSRVWSMSAAGLAPKSAAHRLGSHEDGLEYFVCVNGHLHGACWLVPLSSSDDADGKEEDDDDDLVDSMEDDADDTGLDDYARAMGMAD